MVMESSATTSDSVVSEFEGTLLKNQDLFSYFMLVAFEVSGIIRFTILLFLWPVIKLLYILGNKNAPLKLMIFVATVGVREPEIELVARAVLPKFYMDDVSMDTWRVFSSCTKRVVVTRMPRLMVERFAKEHLGASEIIGTELNVNRFGYVTGLIQETDIDQSVLTRVADLFVDRRPHLGLGRPALTASTTYLSLCEEQIHEPNLLNYNKQQLQLEPPKPVIFHDGRFMKRPTPATALLILLWIPFGLILASIRLALPFVLPLWACPYVLGILCIKVTVKGRPPQHRVAGNSGVLFVGNHKTLIDGLMLSSALGRSIPIIGYSRFRFVEIFSPVPTVWISRNRDIDAVKIKQSLSKGDLTIFPEGTTCREPFVLRFSALFAELTDQILPVAMNCLNPGFFGSRSRGGWDSFGLIFLLMNPKLVYEVTFLNQLPVEDTCTSGKVPYDVANHVQRILADTLGFKCTNFSKKDKYKLIA